MEPARNGRDDPAAVPAAAASQVPQWSPPVMGGMTHPVRSYPARSRPPQWSPPVMGGMTKMKMFGSRASKEPQWSPPVMGGMTGAACRPVTRTPIAAMEPARNGRDDPQDRDPGGRLAPAAAMEPARNGRDDNIEMFQRRPKNRAAMEPARNGRDDRTRPGRGRPGRGCRNGARP